MDDAERAFSGGALTRGDASEDLAPPPPAPCVDVNGAAGTARGPRGPRAIGELADHFEPWHNWPEC